MLCCVGVGVEHADKRIKRTPDGELGGKGGNQEVGHLLLLVRTRYIRQFNGEQQ